MELVLVSKGPRRSEGLLRHDDIGGILGLVEATAVVSSENTSATAKEDKYGW